MKKSSVKSNANPTARWVVVTTDRRGVFAGILTSGQVGGTVTLQNAQMCVYWSKETHGVLGLAATGPAKGSRIGPTVPSIELSGVTAIIDGTEIAKAAWLSQPW